MYAVAVVGLIALAGSAAAQTLPYAPGSRIRFATDPASDWRYGAVVDASRRDVLVLPQGNGDTRLLRFNEQLRLQVYRGRSLKTTALGGGIGLSLGVLAGGTLLSDVVGTQGTGQSRAQSAIVFGLVGTFAGALLASRIGPKEWRDIPVSSGFVAPASLTVEDPPNRSMRKTVHRWDRFDVTEEDFTAFFEQYADSLDPIEGLWVRWRDVRSRVAIVRDRRFDGWEYVMVRVPWGARRDLRTDGRIIRVLRRGDRPLEYETAIPGEHPEAFPLPWEVSDGTIWQRIDGVPVYNRYVPE